MAPEMVNGEPVDERTDVYLLGATLHHALTGEPRHTGAGVEDKLTAASVSASYTYPTNVPAALVELCNAACAPSKDERPASVRQFREALLAFQRRRGPIAICRVAADRLARLERLVEGPIQPSELALAYRLAAEARFGFAEALAQCPDLEEARWGYATTVEALVNLELHQEHVATAEALLEEAPGESLARLRPRLESARHAIVEKHAEQRRLRALAMDVDPAVGRRQRSFLVLALLVLHVALALASQWRALHLWDTVLGLAIVAMVVLVVTAAWVFVDRKRLVANGFGRAAIGFLLVAEGTVVVNRVLGVIHRMDYDTVATYDVLLCGVMFAAGGAAFIPELAACAPVFLGGIVLATWRPDWTPYLVPWLGPVCVALSILAVEMHRRRESLQREGRGNGT
jgi:serine/threonine-protein kinase